MGGESVRIELYNYSAAMFDRYPKGTSAIRGTGCSTPVFSSGPWAWRDPGWGPARSLPVAGPAVSLP